MTQPPTLPFQTLWFMRPMSTSFDPKTCLTNVNGIKGFLCDGDIEFLWQVGSNLPRGGKYAEIGSWMGLSSIVVANALVSKLNLSARVYCIDTWEGSTEHGNFDVIKDGNLYDVFKFNTSSTLLDPLIVPVRKSSFEAHKFFDDESLDVLFIDGDHSSEGCYKDLDNWYSKVKPGGRLIGHDAMPDAGARYALEKFCKLHNLEFTVLDPPKGQYIFEIQSPLQGKRFTFSKKHSLNYKPELLRKANSLFEEQKFDKALIEYQEYLNLEPYDLEPSLQQIVTSMLSQNMSHALTLIIRLLGKFPDNQHLLNSEQVLLKTFEIDPNLEIYKNWRVNNLKYGKYYTIPTSHELIESKKLQGEILELTSIQSSDGRQSPRITISKDIIVGKEHLLLYITDGTLLRDSSPYVTLHDKIESDLLPQNPDFISGDSALIGHPWASNFWHWIFESLPRLIFLKRINFKGKYIVEKKTKFVVETLKFFDVDESDVIEHSRENGMRFENLYIPQVYDGATVSKSFPSVFEEIREAILSQTKTSTDSSDFNRIYLERDSIEHRSVYNKWEVAQILDLYGFKTIKLSEISFADQVNAVRNAKVLIMDHGGGSTHCLFMPRNGHVIEFFPPKWINPCNLNVIKYFGHTYQSIVGGVGDIEDLGMNKIYVNIDQLEMSIRMTLRLVGEL